MDLDLGHASYLARVLEAEEADLDAELDRAAVSAGHVHRQILTANPPDPTREYSDSLAEHIGSIAFSLAAPMESTDLEIAALMGALADARRLGLRLC